RRNPRQQPVSEMSSRPDGPTGTPEPPRSALGNTPNAEKYVIEADAMRRRQLRSALLHGSRRTWREHKRAWPPVAVGVVVAGVIVAGIVVVDAIEVTQQNQQQQEQQRQEQIEQRNQQQQEPRQ